MPTNRRTRMRAPRPPAPSLTLAPGQRARIAALLAAVSPDAGDDDPAFIRLCAAWEDVRDDRRARRSVSEPWVFDGVRTYRCAGGAFLTAGVEHVCGDIRSYCEAR